MNMRGMFAPMYQLPSCACAAVAPPNATQAASAAAEIQRDPIPICVIFRPPHRSVA